MIFKNDQVKGDLDGFLDSGSRVVGELQFDDTFRVDGRNERLSLPGYMTGFELYLHAVRRIAS